MFYILVITSSLSFPLATYFINESVEPGDVVEISIRNNKFIGIVQKILTQKPDYNLKEAFKVHTTSHKYLEYVEAFSKFNLLPISFMPHSIEKFIPKNRKKFQENIYDFKLYDRD